MSTWRAWASGQPLTRAPREPRCTTPSPRAPCPRDGVLPICCTSVAGSAIRLIQERALRVANRFWRTMMARGGMVMMARGGTVSTTSGNNALMNFGVIRRRSALLVWPGTPLRSRGGRLEAAQRGGDELPLDRRLRAFHRGARGSPVRSARTSRARPTSCRPPTGSTQRVGRPGRYRACLLYTSPSPRDRS